MSGDRPIIIIRRKKAAHGHHGGAWKIAFADFMTAMMAFFLVMWILSSSSAETRVAVGEYFSTPLLVAMAGGDRSHASDSAIPGGGPDPTHIDGERARIDFRERNRTSDEQERLRNLEQRIEQAIEADPALNEVREQIRMDLTPEGLRIQLVDTASRPMFEVGSARVAPYMRSVLRTIAPLLNELPNNIQIVGHTDNRPYPGGDAGYGNWELSSERANASRSELVAGGLALAKLLRIAGMADRIPLEDVGADDPMNRRIEVIVLDQRTAGAIRRQSTYVIDDAPVAGRARPAAVTPPSAAPVEPTPTPE